MYQIIAPTLFQHRICRLPGIGTLLMVTQSAQTDFVDSKIKAPIETIEFIPETSNENTFNEFSAMSELMLKNLEEQGSVALKGIGTLNKNAEGIIDFSPLSMNPVFAQAVPVERVIRENAAHAILVGDQQSTNVEMAEYFIEKPLLLKERWKLVALALGLIAVSIFVYYFSKHGFNNLGNARPV